MIFSEMGVVIIAKTVITPDADAPAAVLIPADSFHDAAFDSDNGGAGAYHQVVAEVLAVVSIRTSGTEIVIMCVVISAGDW